MKNVFAKIFEHKGSQVLVTKQFIDNDGNGDEYQVSFEYRAFENMNVNQKLCFLKEEHQNEVFEKVNQETVDEMFDGIGDNFFSSKSNDDE